jgi:GNAT superfamily N-acetyltransferase
MTDIDVQNAQSNLGAIIIRLAQSKDAEPVAMMCHALGYPTSPEQAVQRLQKLQTNHQDVVYVALQNSETVVGWVHGHICNLVITSPLVLIHGLIVDSNYRGQGIGRRLMQKVEQWAYENKCDTVLVRSNVIRTEAHLFYQKIGYETVKQSQVFSKRLS